MDKQALYLDAGYHLNQTGLTVISRRLRISGKNREKRQEICLFVKLPLIKEYFFLLQKIEDIKQKIQ